MNKKGLCMLLAATLVFAAALPLMPRTAAADFAVNITNQTDWENLIVVPDAFLDEPTGEIILSGNVTGSLAVPSGVKTLTIRGNGYTITGDSTYGYPAITMEGASTLILDGKIKIEGEGGMPAVGFAGGGILQLADGADVTMLCGTSGNPYNAILSVGDLTIHFEQGSKLVATNGKMDFDTIWGYSPVIVIWGNLTFTGSPARVHIYDNTNASEIPAIVAYRVDSDVRGMDVAAFIDDIDDDIDDDQRTYLFFQQIDYTASTSTSSGASKLLTPLLIPVSGEGKTPEPPTVSGSYDEQYNHLYLLPTQLQFLNWLRWISEGGAAVIDTSYLLSIDSTLLIEPQWILDLYAADATDEMKALGEKLQSLTIMHRNGSVVVPWEWLVQAAQNAGPNDKIGIHLLSGSVIFKMTIGGKNAELKVSAPAVLSMKFTPAKGRAPESYTLVNKESKNVATDRKSVV